MKRNFRRNMQNLSSYMELLIAAILSLMILLLITKFVISGISGIWQGNRQLDYFLEQAMTLAIGVEFVKMLCQHTPQTIVEVLLFAISRQMIVEHTSAMETAIGVGAIAGLFAIRKYLFCSFDETDRIICRGSQRIKHTNLVTGIKIPADENELLRDVLAEQLKRENKTIAIGACVYYREYALRVDNMKGALITRVEVIKSL